MFALKLHARVRVAKSVCNANAFETLLLFLDIKMTFISATSKVKTCISFKMTEKLDKWIKSERNISVKCWVAFAAQSRVTLKRTLWSLEGGALAMEIHYCVTVSKTVHSAINTSCSRGNGSCVYAVIRCKRLPFDLLENFFSPFQMRFTLSIAILLLASVHATVR